MIFSTGLKKIYESISKQPEKKQPALLNHLHEKIAANKAIAHKFYILDKIQENKGRFSKDVAKKFFTVLEAKHDAFLKENNKVALFYKEEKALFEYFNINQKEVVSDKLDLIVNKKDNKLNESIILDYITNPSKPSKKETLEESKSFYKSYYSGIKNSQDVLEFEDSVTALQKESRLLPEGERKRLVQNAIKSVHTESFSNFESAVEKLYKLKVLNEKFILEYYDDEDEYVDDFADEDDDAIEPEQAEDDSNWEKQAKKVTIGDLDYIKNAILWVPKDFDLDFAVAKFFVWIYPIQPNMSEIMSELGQVKSKDIPKLIRPIKMAVLNKAKGFFEASDVHMTTELAISSPVPGKAIKLKFTVFLNVNESAPASLFPVSDKGAERGQRDLVAGYSNALAAVVKELDAYLPTNQALQLYLTPEAMEQAISAKGDAGRKTSYTKHTATTKYWNDKRQQTGKDNWTNMIMQGDARTEEDEPMTDDWMKDIDSGQGIEPGSAESDDDRIDREAQEKAAQALANKKKPTLLKKAA